MPANLRPYAAPATLISLAVMVAFAVVSALALGGERARASQVSCGETITADTTLDRDLVHCPNNGIVIGADDITLDLNGHRIDGDGTEFATCRPRREFCDVGLLSDGHDGVTVRGGSVRDFGAGVFVGKARHNRVLGIASSRNQSFGFVIADSARILVRDSSGNRNPAPDGDGIGVFGSRHVRILASAFRRNALGMHVEDSTRTRIKGSVISRNENAIGLEADGNEVRRNRVSRNGDGISIRGNRNLVRGNRVVRTSGAGGFAIALEKGDDNVIARNSVRGSEMVAVSVGSEPGAGNVVRRNRIRGAGKAGVLVDSKGVRTLLVGNVIRAVAEDGILVKSTAEQTVLSRNRSFGAQDDGIDVDSASTRLSENTASRNHELGIEAVFGVDDGGGNRASGNGDPRQCLNIACH